MKKMMLFVGWSLCPAASFYLWCSQMAVQAGDITLLDISALMGYIAYAFFFLQTAVLLTFPWTEPVLGTSLSYRLQDRFALMALAALTAHIVLFASVYGKLPRGIYLWPAYAGIFLSLLKTAANFGYQAGLFSYELRQSIHKTNGAVFPLFFIHGMIMHRENLFSPFTMYLCALFLLWAALHGALSERKKRLIKESHKIIDVMKENHEVWTVLCEKNNFSYLPGQYAFVSTLHNGRISAPHPFSLTSHPGGKHLSFTVKWLGEFTSTIHHLTPGDHLIIDGPYGQFSFLNYKASEMVFIAGGIGITPLFSMLRYAHKVKSRHPITLLWGNKRKEDIIFRQELKQMTLDMERFKVVHVLSRDKSKRGERGHVDLDRIKKYVEHPFEAHYFICAPKEMRDDIIRGLLAWGVPETGIHLEKFSLP